MQPLQLLSIVLLIATCAAYIVPQLEYGAPPAAGTISQYHTQDELGQYAYGYTAPLHSKHETRTADGVTRGTYSYVDAAGEVQTVKYTADASGFRVAATNLPHSVALQPNDETAEVATLRAQHLATHAEVKLRLAGGQSLDGLPQPVQDTPEVAAAKLQFFKRFEADKLRHELLSKKQQSSPLPSRLVLSQPIYVKALPATGFVYNYQKMLSRDYLPLS